MSELCARSELVSRLEAKLTAGRQDGQGKPDSPDFSKIEPYFAILKKQHQYLPTDTPIDDIIKMYNC